jgi:tetratricopeptide (TPR) repeat protein
MASLVENKSYLNSKDSDSDEECQTLNVTEEMIEEAKAQAIVLKAEGNAFFSAQDYDSAIKKYSAAINGLKNANLPKDAILLLNRSAAYIGAKRYVPALNDANQAIEVDPSNWKSHWRKAISLMSMSKRRFRTIQAVEALEACLSCGKYTNIII